MKIIDIILYQYLFSKIKVSDKNFEEILTLSSINIIFTLKPRVNLLLFYCLT